MPSQTNSFRPLRDGYSLFVPTSVGCNGLHNFQDIFHTFIVDWIDNIEAVKGAMELDHVFIYPIGRTLNYCRSKSSDPLQSNT